MFVKNEKGITLIELLAVLVLVSLIGTLIMTTFTISYNYNVTETKKLKMQQEANYLVSFILQKHRTLDAYKLSINSDSKLVFEECKKNEEAITCDGLTKIIGKDYNYSLLPIPKIIVPKESDYSTTLVVKDPNKNDLEVRVKTRFARYKSTIN